MFDLLIALGVLVALAAAYVLTELVWTLKHMNTEEAQRNAEPRGPIIKKNGKVIGNGRKNN